MAAHADIIRIQTTDVGSVLEEEEGILRYHLSEVIRYRALDRNYWLEEDKIELLLSRFYES